MNDFTKQELIEIVEYCNWPPGSLGFSDFRLNLYIKIQSLIDNHCEHQWVFYISPNGHTVRCTKCNKGIPE